MQNNNLNFYTFGINNNTYFKNNIKQYIDIFPAITRIIYNNEINNILINKLNDNKSLFVISNIDNNYSIDKLPLYPIILFNQKIIIITSILLQQIGGIPINNNFDNVLITILGNIKKYIGGVITDNINKVKDYKGDTVENYFGKSPFEKKSAVVKISSKNSVTNFQNCYHGWLSKSTKLNLKYAIQTFKPKNILELGSWFGKSASYMINLMPDSNFYFFDKFQNICKSPYKIEKFNVLDKFYFTYPRFETFYKNITDLNYTGDIYAIRNNAFDSLDMLKKYNIEVNMIFIDFCKKTDELITFLNKCIKIYPNAIIVGDDYVFDTVKQALFEFISQNKYYIGLLPESYILSPNKLEKYNELYKKFSKKDDKDKNNDKNNDKVDILKELITSNEFEKAIELIKK